MTRKKCCCASRKCCCAKKPNRRTYTLTLLPRLEYPHCPVTTRSALMDADFDAPTCHGAFQIRRRDRIRVRIKITACRDRRRELRHLRVDSMKILTCPSPGKTSEFFTLAFRRDQDHPDNYILATGLARFEEKKRNKKKVVYVMEFPRHLPFLRPGNFTMIYLLTLRNECTGELFNFIDDPEIEVTGGYP